MECKEAMKIHVSLLLILFLFLSCAPTETVTERDPYEYPEEPDEAIEEELIREMDEFEILLYENRSRLSDQFSTIQHDMPEVFLKEQVQEEVEVDEYAGFRVQILSTRDVSLADSTRDHFMDWASTRISGYEPEAYVFFRQPYYRVRTGDFRNRQTAIEFSRIVKDRYPDAWVVHDRIEPDRVPPDTATIELKDPSEVLQQVDF